MLQQWEVGGEKKVGRCRTASPARAGTPGQRCRSALENELSLADIQPVSCSRLFHEGLLPWNLLPCGPPKWAAGTEWGTEVKAETTCLEFWLVACFQQSSEGKEGNPTPCPGGSRQRVRMLRNVAMVKEGTSEVEDNGA